MPRFFQFAQRSPGFVRAAVAAMESSNSSLNRQSIAKWTLLRLGILLLLVGSCFFLVSSLLLAHRFDAFEDAQYRQELARVRAVIEQDSQALSATISDYAAWDASYRFIHNRDPVYLEENFTFESMSNLRVAAKSVAAR